MFSLSSVYSPSLCSSSRSLSTNGRTTPSTKMWTTPSTSHAIDFPEVPASIAARIRREPFPMNV
ncbi:uncharacterized protein B0H18DRAFT_1005047 [Fomitopsis serialis]|uniref:uncharacterized protein n=1 Tax=Fomitopsis serialis TaxID=139415 RepID=UPI0020084CD7|nr:uncharacterized protein B0H18DRAFT_1005047 [Neoantrodia serialis]KAH9926674.1 hypothetical protein B0H18DRAFT_1005047 [Neoantrodia serialis]